MGGGSNSSRTNTNSSNSHNAKQYPLEYLLASGLSATINYPLWRASAIGQSGFVVASTNSAAASAASSTTILASLAPYRYALSPPYKGALATVLGMTWARAAIFWGSDAGRDWLLHHNYCTVQVATIVPPLVVSTLVQFVNMPLVRATVTIQNPQSTVPNVWQSIQLIYQQNGLAGLWHGTSAGVLKTVPKYCTAIIVKDAMEGLLPPVEDPSNRQQKLTRSAWKSAAAGVAGATLTNPLDVIRNEMFKTNLGFMDTIQHLRQQHHQSWNFMWRGLGKNMIAVAIPVACTLFFTDALIQYTQESARSTTKNMNRIGKEDNN